MSAALIVPGTIGVAFWVGVELMRWWLRPQSRRLRALRKLQSTGQRLRVSHKIGRRS